MNSTDLLCSIAEIDEDYLNESERFEAIGAIVRSERKRQARRITAVGGAFVVCVAIAAALKRAPINSTIGVSSEASESTPGGNKTSETPPDGASSQIWGSDVTLSELFEGKDGGQSNGGATASRSGNAGSSYAGEKKSGGQQKSAGTSSNAYQGGSSRSAESQTAATSSASTGSKSSAATPGSVHTKVSVSYEEAKEKFGHPILECTREDFVGYRLGIVSRNGDIGSGDAFYLDVSYEFTNGIITLMDQDRITGNVARYDDRWCEYRGRVFYLSPVDFVDAVEVDYFPNGENGIAYQAYFDLGADVNEIMDLIISLEIK